MHEQALIEKALDDLQKIVKDKQHGKVSGVKVDMTTASVMLKVYDALKSQGVFAMFSEDVALGLRKQPKWKQRFTNASAYLIKMGCIEIRGKHPDAPKQQRGVQYRITGYGLQAILDICNMGVWLCRISNHRKLEIDDIPKALAGRPIKY